MKVQKIIGYVAIVMFGLSTNVMARELTGYVSNIIDVDVWDVGGETIQLWGLAVPEPGTHQVDDFEGKIKTLINNRKIQCVSVDGDNNSSYPLMKCVIGGFDASRLLIRDGYARDCPKVTDGKYAFDEKFAIDARGARISEWFPVPRECFN